MGTSYLKSKLDQGFSADGGNNLNALKYAAQKKDPESTKLAAKQFEGMFVQMLMKSMRESLPKDGLLSSSAGDNYQSMLDQQLTQKLSDRGIGLQAVLQRQIEQLQHGKPNGVPPPPTNIKPLQPQASQPIPLNKTTGQTNIQFNWKTNTAQPLKYIEKPVLNQGSVQHTQATVNKQSKALPQKASEFIAARRQDAEIASRQTGIPANFILGQAGLESGWGKHQPKMPNGDPSHNLFGIKAGKNWTGKVVETTTTEYINGQAKRMTQKFRAYDSYADAFADHARLLKNNARYAKVVGNTQNPEKYAQEMKNAGYATDPNYAKKLTSAIYKAQNHQAPMVIAKN